MEQTRISFEQAKQAGSDIQAIASEINQLLAEVSVEMEKIGGDGTTDANANKVWQGNTANKFRNDFENLKQSFAKVYNAIDTMGQAINASSAMYQKGEGIE